MGENKSLTDLIKKDFSALEKLNIPITSEAKAVLFPQSILGHAHSGHTVFKDNVLPDLTMDDIYSALDQDPKESKEKRENYIMELVECVDDLMDGKINRLVNRKGEGLFGFKSLESITLNVDKNFFKGGVLAGRMDSNYWRTETVNNYQVTLNGEPLEIGSGKEERVNIKVMKEQGMTLKDLAEGKHSEKDLDKFRKTGLIVDEKIGDSEDIENVFIRTQKGNGCCDDACLTSIGLLHGKDAMLLAWAIDAADTYTKSVQNPIKGGFDEWVGEYINLKWKMKYREELVTPEETKEVIYLGAKNNHPKINFSSSHRKFDQIEKNQQKPTIFNHYKYIETGKRPKGYKLGFDKFDSNKFYMFLEKRFDLYGKKDVIPERENTSKKRKKEKLKLSTENHLEKAKIKRKPKFKKETSPFTAKRKLQQKENVSIEEKREKVRNSKIELIANNPDLIGLEGAEIFEINYLHPKETQNNYDLILEKDGELIVFSYRNKIDPKMKTKTRDYLTRKMEEIYKRWQPTNVRAIWGNEKVIERKTKGSSWYKTFLKNNIGENKINSNKRKKDLSRIEEITKNPGIIGLNEVEIHKYPAQDDSFGSDEMLFKKGNQIYYFTYQNNLSSNAKQKLRAQLNNKLYELSDEFNDCEIQVMYGNKRKITSRKKGGAWQTTLKNKTTKRI